MKRWLIALALAVVVAMTLAGSALADGGGTLPSPNVATNSTTGN